MQWVFLVILLLPALLLVVGGIYGYYRLRRFLRDLGFGGTRGVDWMAGFREATSHAREAPRSLTSTEPISLPELKKDFPELNVAELKNAAARLLSDVMIGPKEPAVASVALEGRPAGDAGTEAVVVTAGQESQVSGERAIAEAWWQMIKPDKPVSRAFVHRIAIKRYERGQSNCTLTLQAALEYGGEDWRMQDRADLQYVFIRVDEGKGISLVCGNCGAPVRSLGAKACDFCQSVLDPLNRRVWRLDRVQRT